MVPKREEPLFSQKHSSVPKTCSNFATENKKNDDYETDNKQHPEDHEQQGNTQAGKEREESRSKCSQKDQQALGAC